MESGESGRVTVHSFLGPLSIGSSCVLELYKDCRRIGGLGQAIASSRMASGWVGLKLSFRKLPAGWLEKPRELEKCPWILSHWGVPREWDIQP